MGRKLRVLAPYSTSTRTGQVQYSTSLPVATSKKLENKFDRAAARRLMLQLTVPYEYTAAATVRYAAAHSGGVGNDR